MPRLVPPDEIKRPMSIRVTPELRRQIATAAREEGVSVTDLVTETLQQRLEGARAPAE